MSVQQTDTRPINPQLQHLVATYQAQGRIIVCIRMAPMDVARLAGELGIYLPQKPREIRIGRKVIRSLVWDLKNGYILQSSAGPIQVMPDLSVIPGHIELADAQGIPLYGLQKNN